MSKVACIYLYQWSKGSTGQHNQPAWGYRCWVLPFQPHCKSSKLLIQLSHLGSSYLGVLWLICTRLMRHELNDKQKFKRNSVWQRSDQEEKQQQQQQQPMFVKWRGIGFESECSVTQFEFEVLQLVMWCTRRGCAWRCRTWGWEGGFSLVFVKSIVNLADN